MSTSTEVEKLFRAFLPPTEEVKEEKAPSRKANVDRGQSGEFSSQELMDLIPTDPFPMPPPSGPLTPEELDQLADELVDLRLSQDLLQGRHEYLREASLQALDLDLGTKDASTTPHVMVSSKGHQIKRTVRGGKPDLDLEKLKAQVSEKVWKSITVEEVTTVKVKYKGRIVEEATTTKIKFSEPHFVEAVNRGDISEDQVRSCITLTPKVPTFTVIPGGTTQ